MRPLDPRLLRYAHAAGRYLTLAVVIGVVTAVVVVAQAWLIAELVDGGFIQGDGVAELRRPLVGLGVVLVLRAGLLWITETTAHRSSAEAKSELRMRMLRGVIDRGAAVEASPSTGDLTALATRGVDALDGYFARYLPQLVLCVVVPLTVLLALLWSNLVAALIVAVTIPLIPLFMVVIGKGTQAGTSRQLRTLQRLSGKFLDVVAGLPTLKIFGRARDQAQAIRAVADEYRRTTMSTLRLAFMSSLVLELLAMLSVALVAVYVGLRLRAGDLDFRTALFVLLLAPEAYAPLRNLGASFHASAEGLAAVEQVFALIEADAPERGRRTDLPDPKTATLEVCDLGRGVRRGEGNRCSTASRCVSSRARPWPSPGRAVSASRRCSPFCWVSYDLRPAQCGSTGSTSPTSTRTSGAARSPGFRSVLICSPGRSPTTCAWDVPRHRRAPSPRLWQGPA